MAWKNLILSLLLPLLLLTLTSPEVAFAGGHVGNGGDSVRCSPTRENRFNGLYTLDYLLTLGVGGLERGTVAVKTWEESKNRLVSLLRLKAPNLSASFEAFLQDLDNMHDWTKRNIWLPAPHGLLAIDDQKIIRALPLNCHQVVDEKRINIIQTVIRIKKPEITEYEVDVSTMVQLMDYPLQYSYLLVHEWLWNFADDVQSIRWANQFLHSDQMENLSAADVQKSLRNIGIESIETGSL